MLGCCVNVDYTDPRNFQVLVRGGYYFFETRVFRRNGADALRLPEIGKGCRKLKYSNTER
jgi:hypothetical protein